MGLGQADKEGLSYSPRREGGTGFERKTGMVPSPHWSCWSASPSNLQGTNPKVHHPDTQGHLGLGDRQRHSQPRTDITEILRI